MCKLIQQVTERKEAGAASEYAGVKETYLPR